MIGDDNLKVCTKRLVDVENRGLKRGDTISPKQQAIGERRRRTEDIKEKQAFDKEWGDLCD